MKVKKAFRDNLARVARTQLFTHDTPEAEVRELFSLLVATHLKGEPWDLRNGGPSDLDRFIAENRSAVDSVIEEAIRRAKAAPR
jgi:hypothetical protein